jgi:hypothetical protein
MPSRKNNVADNNKYTGICKTRIEIIESDIKSILMKSRCEYDCSTKGGGINVIINSGQFTDEIMINPKEMHVMLEHNRRDNLTGKRTMVFLLCSIPELSRYIARHSPPHSYQPKNEA